MPNITQFNAPPTPERATSGGEEAFLNLARRDATLYAEGGERLGRAVQGAGRDLGTALETAQQHQEMHETGQMNADASELFAGTLKSYQQAVANTDPNNPQALDQWHQDTFSQENQEQFVGRYANMRVQERAQDKYAQLSQHFQEKIGSDQSTLSGEASVLNITRQNNANATILGADPSSIDLVNGNVDQAIADAKARPFMTAESRSRLDAMGNEMKRGNAFAAAKGMVDGNPDQAVADLPKFLSTHSAYLKPEDVENLTSHATTMQRMAKRDAETDALRQREQARQDSLDMQNKFYSSLVDPQTRQLSIPADARTKVLTSNMQGAQKVETVRFLDELAHAPAATDDPKALTAITARIADTDADPGDLTKLIGDAANAGLITAKTAAQKNTEIGMLNKLSPDDKDLYKGALEMMQSQIAPATPVGMMSAPQAQKVLRFKAWFGPAFNAAVRAGDKPAELLSADNPKFMLGPDIIKRFTQTQPDDVAGSSLLDRLVGAGKAAAGAPSAEAPIVPPKNRRPLDSILGPAAPK